MCKNLIISAAMGVGSFITFYEMGYSSGGGLIFTVLAALVFMIGLFRILRDIDLSGRGKGDYENYLRRKSIKVYNKFDGRVFLTFEKMEEGEYILFAYIQKKNNVRDKNEEKKVGLYLKRLFFGNILESKVQSIIVTSVNSFLEISRAEKLYKQCNN